MTIKRTANLGFDGSTVTATIGKATLRLVSAGYGDKLETAWLPSMGSQTQGEQTRGTYKCDELKVKMSAVVFRRDYMPTVPQNGAGNVSQSIVIGNVHPDLGSDSDLLSGCRCTNWAAAVDNSNKAQEVDVNFTITQIFWGDARKTINTLAPAGT